MTVASNRSRGYTAIAEILCPLIILVVLIDSMQRAEWTTYQRDPAIYASIARFWQDGLIPYRDVWEFKPPMIFVALRAGFALWGYEADSLRRIFMILLAIGALLLYAGLRRARCLIAAPVAALGLLTLIVVNPWGLPWQNTESLVAAFGAAAIGCAAAHQRDARWWWAVLAGVCLGLATLGKQPAALFAPALGMQLCLWGLPEGWRGRTWYVLQRGLFGLAGFTLVVVAFVIYFASQGAATDLYNAIWVDGARYSGDFGLAMFRPEMLGPVFWPRTPTLAKDILGNRQMWPFVGAIALLVPLTFLGSGRWTATVWMWLVTAALAVLAGPAGENHYLVMTLPALALTTGIVAELVVSRFRGSARDAPDSVRLLGGFAIAILLYGSLWRTGYLPRRTQTAGPNDYEVQVQRLGRQIHAAAQPGDLLFVEDEPIHLYLYAGLPPASRFIYWNAPNPHVDAERDAAIKNKPAFIFVTRNTQQRLQTEKLTASPHPHPWGQYLAESYEPWVTESIGTVYRRRPELPVR